MGLMESRFALSRSAVKQVSSLTGEVDTITQSDIDAWYRKPSLAQLTRNINQQIHQKWLLDKFKREWLMVEELLGAVNSITKQSKWNRSDLSSEMPRRLWSWRLSINRKPTAVDVNKFFFENKDAANPDPRIHWPIVDFFKKHGFTQWKEVIASKFANLKAAKSFLARLQEFHWGGRWPQITLRNDINDSPVRNKQKPRHAIDTPIKVTVRNIDQLLTWAWPDAIFKKIKELKYISVNARRDPVVISTMSDKMSANAFKRFEKWCMSHFEDIPSLYSYKKWIHFAHKWWYTKPSKQIQRKPSYGVPARRVSKYGAQYDKMYAEYIEHNTELEAHRLAMRYAKNGTSYQKPARRPAAPARRPAAPSFEGIQLPTQRMIDNGCYWNVGWKTVKVPEGVIPHGTWPWKVFTFQNKRHTIIMQNWLPVVVQEAYIKRMEKTPVHIRGTHLEEFSGRAIQAHAAWESRENVRAEGHRLIERYFASEQLGAKYTDFLNGALPRQWRIFEWGTWAATARNLVHTKLWQLRHFAADNRPNSAEVFRVVKELKTVFTKIYLQKKFMEHNGGTGTLYFWMSNYYRNIAMSNVARRVENSTWRQGKFTQWMGDIQRYWVVNCITQDISAHEWLLRHINEIFSWAAQWNLQTWWRIWAKAQQVMNLVQSNQAQNYDEWMRIMLQRNPNFLDGVNYQTWKACNEQFRRANPTQRRNIQTYKANVCGIRVECHLSPVPVEVVNNGWGGWGNGWNNTGPRTVTGTTGWGPIWGGSLSTQPGTTGENWNGGSWLAEQNSSPAQPASSNNTAGSDVDDDTAASLLGG